MMLKKTRIWLLIAALLVAVGIGMFAGVMSINRWDFIQLGTEPFETNTHTISDSFESIQMQTDTADIAFVPSADGECKVVCCEPENARHTVAVRDGILTVTENSERDWYNYVGIHVKTPTITVFLPAGDYNLLSINESTGDIRIPTDFRFAAMEITTSTGDVETAADVSGNIKIQTDTGDVRVDKISADSLNLTVSTGRITVRDVTCEKDVSVHVDTGDAMLMNVACGSLTSTGDTGKLELKNVVAKNIFSITRSTGDVKFDGCDASEIIVETDTGDVKGSFLSAKIIFTETSTGDVHVPQSTTGGSCKITTSTGDIEINIP